MQTDFFDDYPQEVQQTNYQVQQASSSNNYDFFEEMARPQTTSSQGDQATTQFNNGMSPLKTDAFVSPEQLQRREKLRNLEEERLRQVRQKDEAERTEKQQRQQKAQQYLQQWKQQYQDSTSQRKAQNRTNQEVLIEARKSNQEYKNSWEKVTANISLKDGEYPGQKDVSKMRQAIINKRKDLAK